MDTVANEKHLASDLLTILDNAPSTCLTIEELRSLERLVFELREIAQAEVSQKLTEER